MIAPAVVQEIRRLLVDQKLSQRKVARLTGVSRGTIGRIASGQRPDDLTVHAVPEWPEPSGPPQRCPSCGGMVDMPCRLCFLRRRMTGRLRRPVIAATTSDTGLELDLSAEFRARYELVHSRIAIAPREECQGGILHE